MWKIVRKYNPWATDNTSTHEGEYEITTTSSTSTSTSSPGSTTVDTTNPCGEISLGEKYTWQSIPIQQYTTQEFVAPTKPEAPDISKMNKKEAIAAMKEYRHQLSMWNLNEKFNNSAFYYHSIS